MSLVYLAGAIDLVSKEERNNWRSDAKEILNKYGISTVDPTGTFSYVKSGNVADDKKTAKDLIQINKINMLMSDVVLIVLSANKPSIGTPIELWICVESNKDIVVLWDGDPNFIPAYIEGLVRNKDIVGTFDQALELVIEKCENQCKNLSSMCYNGHKLD